MTQTASIPNNAARKIFGEQSTGAETAALVDATGHLQVDVISGAVADAAVLAKLTTIDVDTGAQVGSLTTIDVDTDATKTATEKVATEVGVGTGLLVRQGTMGGTLVEKAYAYSHAITSGVVKAGAGFVHSISINTPATASVVTLYNDPAAATPGTEIAIITRDVGDLAGEVKILDVLCPLGIYVGMAVADVDVTVSYR